MGLILITTTSASSPTSPTGSRRHMPGESSSRPTCATSTPARASLHQGSSRVDPAPDLKGQELAAIGGLHRTSLKIPPGCAFNPRCTMAQDVCRQDRPLLLDIGPNRKAACHFSREVLGA